jgi:hypothetical protein
MASAITLGIGVAVYLYARGGDVYFVPQWIASGFSPRPLFGPLGGSLPSFLHVFAFILLTAAVLRPGPRLGGAICMTWVVVDGLFEIGQLEGVRGPLVAWLPEWFSDLWLLNRLAPYFQFGTFDILDLALIVTGGIAAYLYVVWTK